MTAVITGFYGRWAFLSNFYPAALTWEGITYPTAEHAYNAGKTISRAHRYALAEAPTPQKARKLGRDLELRTDWDEARYEVMRDVLWAKFAAHPLRAAALLATGNTVLIEGQSVGDRWHDQHWGDCYCGRRKCATPGANHLGFMLMELRSELEWTI